MTGDPFARDLGLIASSASAGMALGIIDASDTLAGGFAVGLGALDVAVVVAVAAAALGLMGLVAGLAAAFARRLARHVLGERPGLARAGAALACGALVAGVAGLWALTWAITTGTGHGAAETAAATAAGSLGGAAVVAVVLSRRWCPRWGRAGAWLAALAMLYLLESRQIYEFSRQSRLASVHWSLLVVLVLVAGVGLWAVTPRLHAGIARRRRSLAIALVAFALAALAAVFTNECFGYHRVRLVLHERTSLAFRPLALVPGCARWRGVRTLARWRSSCGSGPPPAPDQAPAATPDQTLRGVVLIVIDSLRGDRLEASRGGDLVAPNLVRLGERAAVFEHAYTTIPGTLRALAVLMSGAEVAPAGPVDLGDALRAAEIETRVVAGHANLAESAGRFDVFDDRASRERFAEGRNALTSEHVVGRARAQLATLEPRRRFLLLVHFFDPHAHYVGNPLFDFGDRESERYDAEVKYTDHWLGVLLDELRRFPDVGVVVVSDHGDELGEHRYKRHQLRLYDESTRIPLIVFDPRVAAPSRHRQEVSLADVAPTVLDMLGVEPPASMRGRSLWPAVSGSAALAPRPVRLRSSTGDKWGVVSGRRKVIFDRDSAVLELYDLERDPGELRNLADRRGEEAGGLWCVLNDWMPRRPGPR